MRHDNGQIVSWGIANNALAIPPQILGSTAPVFHIVGIDDFTGDQQADILFRHDNGDIALWQVANNALAGVPKVIGSTSTAYHVVSTGDFDGNGAKDILFRGDNGELGAAVTDLLGHRDRVQQQAHLSGRPREHVRGPRRGLPRPDHADPELRQLQGDVRREGQLPADRRLRPAARRRLST